MKNVISLKEMKKKKKIINYIVLRGLKPLNMHIAVLSS